MLLAADLHIHTVLSPCASRDMRPRAIVREAALRGLGVIAVCDHNSAGNVDAVRAAAAALDDGPFVVPGIEITTAEEVHVLGFFRTPRDACAAGDEVKDGLPAWRPFAKRASAASAASAAARQPEQELVGPDDTVTGIEGKMLTAASTFSLGETVRLIHRHGGLAVAAHVDRRSFSVPGQLGFLPPGVDFDGLEISAEGTARGRDGEFAALGFPLLSSSDAHFLEDIGGGMTLLDIEAPCFDEIRQALRGSRGRRCVIA
jgi:hypothetical protein